MNEGQSKRISEKNNDEYIKLLHSKIKRIGNGKFNFLNNCSFYSGLSSSMNDRENNRRVFFVSIEPFKIDTVSIESMRELGLIIQNMLLDYPKEKNINYTFDVYISKSIITTYTKIQYKVSYDDNLKKKSENIRFIYF